MYAKNYHENQGEQTEKHKSMFGVCFFHHIVFRIIIDDRAGMLFKSWLNRKKREDNLFFKWFSEV